MSRINRDWIVGQEAALAAEIKRELDISVRQAKGIIDGGCAKVNGALAAGHGQRVKAGDQLHVNFDPELRYEVLPPKKKLKVDPFVVLFEDKHLLFVNKPAGLLTVPTETGPQEDNLAEAITDHYKRRGFKRFQLFIVHRLDRFTSGVLVFAKTPEALMGLKKMFALHKLQRMYRAVLVGELPENRGTLAGHLIEQTKSLKMRVVDPKKKHSEGAKEAVTHYRVVERLPGHTVVEVQLETGRRNQIRVQFADKGFPLLGDQVYGAESELLDRQALHAELLGFKHPVTDEQVTVSAALPSDLEAALKKLRNQRRLERAEAGVQGEEGIFKPKITKERKLERISRMKKFEAIAAEREAGREEARGPAPRRDREDRPAKREWKPRREEGSSERPKRTFKPREEGEGSKREWKPRREEGAAERPKREWKPREEGERPRSRAARPEGDRPAKREWKPRREEGPADRPKREWKPKREESASERPKRAFKPREEGDRPAKREWKPREEGGRPDRPKRDFKSREDGDRPAKREWKPRAEGGRPSGERPPRKEGGRAERRDARPGERPAKREWKPRAEGAGPRGPKPAGPKKPFAKKPRRG